MANFSLSVLVEGGHHLSFGGKRNVREAFGLRDLLVQPGRLAHGGEEGSVRRVTGDLPAAVRVRELGIVGQRTGLQKNPGLLDDGQRVLTSNNNKFPLGCVANTAECCAS